MKLSLIAKENLDEVDNDLITIRHELTRLLKSGKIDQEQFLLFTRLVKVFTSLHAGIINATKSVERKTG
ncbi:MAG: hypothetical protein H0U50_04030 [Pyrinomonadaceae bacterium]|nr:hypothetical protein [Pyrinomonadaceae bacterium]